MAQGEEHSIPWPGEKNRVSESRRKPSQLELALGCGVKKEGGTMRMCGESSHGFISGPMTFLFLYWYIFLALIDSGLFHSHP